MQNWEYKKLGELSTEKMSYGTSASSCEYDGEVRYIRITDINDEGDLNDDFVSPESYEEKHVLQDGDIVFARTGATVGKAYCYHESGEKYVYAGYLIRLRPNKQLVNSDYLYYCTKSKDYLEFIRTSQAAAAQPNVNAEKYSNFEIPLPPLEEQKRIVKILDEKFAMLETVKSNAKANLQNAKDLFQSQLTKAFSNTTWEKKRFEELFKLKSGDYLNSKSIVKGDYPIYGGNGIIDYHKEFNLDGDNIIIGRVGALCGNVRYLSEPIWLTDNAFKLSFIDFEYDYKFITYLLNHLNLRSYARQAAQPVISNSSLKDIEIPLPPLLEQKRIVEELDSLSEKVRSLEEIYTKQLANCDELKQAFLAKAFNGEL